MREQKSLTRAELAEMLNINDRSFLTKHADGDYTYTAHYHAGEDTQGRAGEIQRDLMTRAESAGYTLRVLGVSRVLGAERGYVQRFRIRVIRNDADPKNHDLTLVVACHPVTGARSGMAALIIKEDPLSNVGLFETGAGDLPGVEAVFDAIDHLNRPAILTLITDKETANEIKLAQAGAGGRARTRELLSREPGLTFRLLSPDDLGKGSTAVANINAAALLRTYTVCREVAADVVRLGHVTTNAVLRLKQLKKLFRN